MRAHEKQQTAMTPKEILQKHEDANEMHLHHVDRKWVIEAMEEYASLSKKEIVEISDKEIEIFMNSFPYTKHLDDGQYNDGVLVGLELGIEWYREQLKSKQ